MTANFYLRSDKLNSTHYHHFFSLLFKYQYFYWCFYRDDAKYLISFTLELEILSKLKTFFWKEQQHTHKLNKSQFKSKPKMMPKWYLIFHFHFLFPRRRELLNHLNSKHSIALTFFARNSVFSQLAIAPSWNIVISLANLAIRCSLIAQITRF